MATFEELTNEELALHAAKAKDYTGERAPDEFGNFERAGQILNLYGFLDGCRDPRVRYAAMLMLKQFDAAMSMLGEGREGQVENVRTRLMDVSVYAKIIICMHEQPATAL